MSDSSDTTPVVSVVIPAYNHATVLPHTLDSVLAQTFDGPTEILVIDDGSPDDTGEVVKPYLDRGVTYHRKDNGGQASARNAGIKLARGKYVALLDDDDVLPPDKFAWQIDALESDLDAVLVYGEDDRIDGDGKPLPPTPRDGYRRPSGLCHDEFLAGCWIATPGQTLIRRDALDRIGGYDTNIWGSDDWDLYIRLSGLGTFIYDGRIALHYRVHAGNSSGSVLRHLEGHELVVAKHPAPTPQIRQARRRGARAYFLHNLMMLSHAARKRGDLETSLKAQHAAARLDAKVRLRKEWWLPFLLNKLGKAPS